MLDTETKRRIDKARDILVGKVPNPQGQVEQITIALIYKFMDDMDAEAQDLGGKRKFFTGEFAKYGWAKLMSTGIGGHELIGLYGEGISTMPQNPGIPALFRDIFKNAYLPYRDPETLKSFLKIINEFSYDHSERLGDAFEYLLSVLGSQGDAGQLDTPRVITDAVGNKVWELQNTDPFGNNVPNENPTGLGTFPHNLGFAGQYRDRETHTFYNTFRDCYDPATGRYCQSDPIGLRGGLNTYTYVGGNPVSHSDPLGLSPYAWVVKLLDNGGMSIGRGLADKADAVAARQAGENVITDSRQAAKQIEDAANGGAGDIMRHEGHDLPDGSTGLPHYQTEGESGHTFWGKQSGAIDPSLPEWMIPWWAYPPSTGGCDGKGNCSDMMPPPPRKLTCP